MASGQWPVSGYGDGSRQTDHRPLTTGHFIILSLFFFLLSGCSLFEQDNHITVSEDQLYGCWVKSGTHEYWRYRDDGSGVTWDEDDDISEEESNLTFTWTVRGDELTHIFRGEGNNMYVPKIYTIKAISTSTMEWEDDYGIATTLVKTDRKRR